ncbi:unnamed protein product [Phaedon cochleariae]|uniref:Thaumatin-like protein n=1 Tax=Phaedon cochleariae TaxID=80249 RepID=A0A9P0DLR7_PHACE|nr:unnamed protein product [Phaedon cochleariae]
MIGAFVIFCAFMGVNGVIDPKTIRGVQIKNKGNERLWIEMTDEDSFVLPPGQLASVILDFTWSGTISARPEDCQHKKCNSPTTIARLAFGGEKGEDRYHISIADGFNRPMKIQPTGHNNFCKPTACNANINQHCPASHQVKDDDAVVACRSNPELFQKLCPQAVASEGDLKTNTIVCRTSNTYFVSIG